MCRDTYALGGALFCFINARRNKLKLLVWERNGFIVWYKRLEQDKFSGPRHAEERVDAQRRTIELAVGWRRCVAHEALRCSVFS
jgi:hypothetical protein